MSSVQNPEIPTGRYAESPIEKRSILERLHPKKTPALAIQTYEWFVTDSDARQEALRAFLAGEIDNIPLKYIKLFDEDGAPISLENERRSLEDIMRDLRDPENKEFDDETAEITFDSALYRYYEVLFVETVQDLNKPGASRRELIDAAERYRRLNEALYGRPDPETYEKIRGEIWHVIDSKQLHPKAEVFKAELMNGFTDDKGRNIGPLQSSTKRLPRMAAETSSWAVDIINKNFGEYLVLAERYWNEVICPDGRNEFTNDDLYELFVQSLKIMDPTGESGIGVSRKEGSGLLSWDTPTMSVRVGTDERKTPVSSPLEAYSRVLHELAALHGRRCLKGLKTSAPILGLGVFSKFDPDEGERPDYLTFEEAAASLTQSMVEGLVNDEVVSQWTAESLMHYASISQFSLEQKSEREVYEITWRHMLLMDIQDNKEPSLEDIARAKMKVANSFERYKRSIPAELPDEVGVLVWHKDIAYLSGKASAIRVIHDLFERGDYESFLNMLATKTDPTNERQRKFAAKHGYPVWLSDGFANAA